MASEAQTHKSLFCSPLSSSPPLPVIVGADLVRQDPSGPGGESEAPKEGVLSRGCGRRCPRAAVPSDLMFPPSGQVGKGNRSLPPPRKEPEVPRDFPVCVVRGLSWLEICKPVSIFDGPLRGRREGKEDEGLPGSLGGNHPPPSLKLGKVSICRSGPGESEPAGRSPERPGRDVGQGWGSLTLTLGLEAAVTATQVPLGHGAKKPTLGTY